MYVKERLDEIKKCIQTSLPNGYNISDLKKEHMDELFGFVWAILETETAFANLPCYIDDSMRGKLRQEEAEDIWEHVYNSLICSGADVVISIMDNDEYYREEG